MEKIKKRIAKKRNVVSSAKGKTFAVKKQFVVTKEEKAVAIQIARVSINARRRAHNNNADITIIRNGEIIRISAKKPKVIGRVKKTPVTVDLSKPFRIK